LVRLSVAAKASFENGDSNPFRRWPAGTGAVIFALTLIVYLPALTGGFLWNDSDYVTRGDLQSLDGLRRIWTVFGATEQYYPLLHSFFWVQHRLWGDHPLGYHVVTLLLHAGAAVLGGRVLQRLAVPGAWYAALLFALHPVHVESVAWIAEQKNTLSLVGYLGAAWMYLRFLDHRRPGVYLAAVGLFVLALLAKTVTATLPAALLVVLWWKHGRLNLRRDVGPLLPWLLLGAVGGWFSSVVERRILGAEGPEFALPFLERGLVAGRAIGFYLANLVWPSRLNFVYPRWTLDAGAGWQWLFPIGAVALGAALWSIRRFNRGPLAAYLFFVGSLFPVLGFVNLFGARYSWVWDHWQYLADLGPLALTAAGVAWLHDGPASRFRRAVQGGAVVVVAVLGGLTWRHCGMFHDASTLYRETIARNPTCWLAHNNLGTLLLEDPAQLPAAIAHLETAVQVRPASSESHYNLGIALARVPERAQEGIAHLQEALRLKPDFAEAHNDLGAVVARIPGRRSEGIAHLEEALRIRPDYAAAHNNLGIALMTGEPPAVDGLAHFEAALRLKPDFADAHYNLALALLRLRGDVPGAKRQLETALAINPNLASAGALLRELQAASSSHGGR